MIENAVDECAELIVDGRNFEHQNLLDGNFLGSTLLEGVTTEIDIVQTEIFGPVLCLTKKEDLNDAIEMVNSTEYGNASLIFTEKAGEARKYRYISVSMSASVHR